MYSQGFFKKGGRRDRVQEGHVTKTVEEKRLEGITLMAAEAETMGSRQPPVARNIKE